MSDKIHVLRFLSLIACAPCAYAQLPPTQSNGEAAPIGATAERRNQASASVGSPAPPLSIEEFAGPGAPEKLTWGSLEGHVVVLEFWATWCVPCVQNIPHLNTLAEAYYDRGVRFLSISDESRDILERFLRVRPIQGWVALDPDRSMFDAFCKGISIPQTFVVDGQGVLVAGPLDPSELTREVLDAVLNEKPLPARPTSLPVPSARAEAEAEPVGGPPPSPIDETAMLQIVIGSVQQEANRMEWASGLYMNTSVDLETLLVRLFHLRTAWGIRWESPRPSENLRFIAKMPDHREDLFEKIAVPALEACLGLSITRESVLADVYVIAAPEGPGPNLTKSEKTRGTSHRFHPVSTEGILFATEVDVSWLLKDLEEVLGRPIVDETALKDCWDWGLQYEPGDIESLRRAAREQLGLVLTPERRAIDMVVVRKASAANTPERSE